MPEEKRGRLREGLGVLLLVVFSTAGALLAAEFVIRMVAPQQLILLRPDIWEPADSLGWVHRADVDTEVNTGERTVRWTTDHRGFRISAGDQAEVGRSGPAILVLGDSFMAAMQVAYEQSLPGRMQASLREDVHELLRVDNTAVTSWDPPHYLMQARRSLESGQYNLVLVGLYLGNDIVPRRIEAYPRRRPAQIATLRLPREFSRREFVEAIARPINDYLKTRSHLFVFLKSSFDSVLMQFGLSEARVPWEVQVKNRTSEAWRVTTEILSDIAALGRERDIETIFVLIPSSYQVDADILERHGRALGFVPSDLDPDQPNQIMRSLLREYGLRVIDPLDALRRAHREGQQLYGTVDLHFSPTGHEVVWEFVSGAIAAELTRAVGVRPFPMDTTRVQ